jgi:hypothetical protein
MDADIISLFFSVTHEKMEKWIWPGDSNVLIFCNGSSVGSRIVRSQWPTCSWSNANNVYRMTSVLLTCSTLIDGSNLLFVHCSCSVLFKSWRRWKNVWKRWRNRLLHYVTCKLRLKRRWVVVKVWIFLTSISSFIETATSLTVNLNEFVLLVRGHPEVQRGLRLEGRVVVMLSNYLGTIYCVFSSEGVVVVTGCMDWE